MYSDKRNIGLPILGFPIRKSPDHRLLASSRSLSQLTTSFIAYFRQGIHTHALSSLTIKSTMNTNVILVRLQLTGRFDVPVSHAILVVVLPVKIIQMSKIK
jgi:hypothetical protein